MNTKIYKFTESCDKTILLLVLRHAAWHPSAMVFGEIAVVLWTSGAPQPYVHVRGVLNGPIRPCASMARTAKW